MDTFMDQLSQKLNAQEIIRANGEAEAEQMTVLQAQVQEYRECLDRMKQVAEDLGSLSGRIASLPDQAAQSAGAEAFSEDLQDIKRQVAALANERPAAGLDEETLRSLKEEFAALADRNGQGNAELQQIRETLAALSEKADRSGDEETLRGIREQMAQITRENGEQLSRLTEDLMRGIGTEDDFHRECVRIYRNVQAVILEESGKLQEASKLEAERVRQSVKGVKVLAILALIASILSIAAPFVTKFLL